MLREVEAAVLWMDCGTKAIVEAPDRTRKSAEETERFIAAVVCDVPSVQSGGQWAVMGSAVVQWAVVECMCHLTACSERSDDVLS